MSQFVGEVVGEGTVSTWNSEQFIWSIIHAFYWLEGDAIYHVQNDHANTNIIGKCREKLGNRELYL